MRRRPSVPLACALFRNDMKQVDPRTGAGQIPQHSHHLFHVSLAGIGDQEILEHGFVQALLQPMARLCLQNHGD